MIGDFSHLPPSLEEKLRSRRTSHTCRALTSREGIDFSSNDYLGFAEDPVLRAALRSAEAESVPSGSSASRLLRGNLRIYEDLEKELAAFSGREAALFFPSGFQCNLGVLSALFGPEDQVFSDELNHASLIDGLRLSGAQRKIYPHGNLQRLREFLQESTRRGGGLKAIVTESLFSMDGDLARLQELADLAEEYSALLIVDEAHATGLWGDPSKNSGGGLVQKLGLTNRVFATLHTGGKSLGVGGAWVCGSAQLKEYLINFCRAFVFSTAPSPVVVFLVSAALQRWKEVGIERAEKVLETSIALQNLLKQEVACFSHHSAVQGPVIPLVIGDNLATLQIAEHVRKQGYDVRAIRPPTVPEGKARLRLTLHWQNTDEEIRGLVKAMKEATRDWRQNL